MVESGGVAMGSRSVGRGVQALRRRALASVCFWLVWLEGEATGAATNSLTEDGRIERVGRAAAGRPSAGRVRGREERIRY